MAELKMISTEKNLNAITGVAFFIGLHTVTNDDIVLKSVITDDNKQLCYLDVVRPALKHNLCECYNVLVDVHTTNHQLMHSYKTSHSKENWNDKVNAALVRSSFDSIVKILELSTDNNVTFVIERLNPNNLKLEFENMKCVFCAKLKELDIVKLKIPSESEMRVIIAGDRSFYDKRIQERLCCKICLRYDVPSFDGIPVAKLFQCLHFFILNV